MHGSQGKGSRVPKAFPTRPGVPLLRQQRQRQRHRELQLHHRLHAPRPPQGPGHFGGLDINHPSPWHFVYFPARLQAMVPAPGPVVAVTSLPSTTLELRTGPTAAAALPFDLNEPPTAPSLLSSS
ncbi:hypothetical protein ABZP36_013083 [Zizania latifolia]